MSELDKAYETADMLKALDLPISKDRLENIERQEKENGKAHRDDLSFYFYDKCYANHTKRNNEFCLTEWLEARYVLLMQQYMKSSQFDKPTDISITFWHLQSQF